MDLTLPRGIRDIEPEEFERHARVRAAFEGVTRDYNFKVMEPASLEHLSTLRAKSGEDVDKEIYSFLDKGGREVGLRFDLTVGIARYICSRKGLRLPAKVAAFGGMWRYDEPQYGRFRWSHQWDLEIFGPPSIDADAEVVDAASAILKRLEIPAKTRVGDRGVVEEYIREEVGVKDQGKAVELMRALDKVGKKTHSELQSEYTAKGFTKAQVDSVLELGKVSGSPDSVLKRLAEMKLNSTKNLGALRDLLNSRGLEDIEYDLSIVRGIDYYTGIVFEAADRTNPRLGSLFGGGRYDSLPRLFGRPDLSATGAAGGVEREGMSLAQPAETGQVKAYVAYASEEVYQEAVRGMAELRRAGVPSDMSPRNRSLGKQLEDANGSGASWVVITGKRELSKGVVTLKNLKERSEEQLPLKDVLRTLS